MKVTALIFIWFIVDGHEAKQETFLFANKCIRDEKFTQIDVLISDLTACDEKLLTIFEILQKNNLTFIGTKYR